MSEIIYIEKDRIAWIFLNRPEKRNALHAEMLKDLRACFEKAESNEQIRAVCLGAKGKYFCSGADLSLLLQSFQNTDEQNIEDSRRMAELYVYLYTFPKPFVTVLEGPALAGGAGLATISDYCFATKEAYISYPEVKVGYVPAIVSLFLNQKLGLHNAKKLLLTGAELSAEEAKKWGLIEEIYSSDEIMDQVNLFLQQFCLKVSAQSFAQTKKLMHCYDEESFAKNLEKAVFLNVEARKTEDFLKGVQSFMNKEKLNW